MYNLLKRPIKLNPQTSFNQLLELLVLFTQWMLITGMFVLSTDFTSETDGLQDSTVKNWLVLKTLGDPNVSTHFCKLASRIILFILEYIVATNCQAAFFSNKLRMLCREECLWQGKNWPEKIIVADIWRTSSLHCIYVRVMVWYMKWHSIWCI